jgi:seryl-tRNA synthetase
MLRDDPANLARLLARKGVPAEAVERAAHLDKERRAAQGEAEQWRRRKNEGSREVGRAAAADRPLLIAEMTVVADRLKQAEARLAEAEDAAQASIDQLPNPPHESVPSGGEDDCEVVRKVGTAEAPCAGHLDHARAGERLGMWDLARGAKVSGARFAYLTGPGVLLEQALVRLALETALRHDFRLVVPPVLVRERAMYGTGFFPAERSEYYEVDGGELFLVGTSEVPLAAFHADEILDEVPTRYCGLSSCFRRESGTYGKDTSGIFRVHQFTKVELFALVGADDSVTEHERILAVEEEIVGALGLPYRVVNVAAGELGQAPVKKYDVEAWLPSEGRYREITSCSNCTDFQARRLQIRRRKEKETELVHTLNGTAVTDRWMCFLVENYQQADGSVELPDGLLPYMPGGVSVIRP